MLDTSSIVLNCDAGIAVVLLGDTDLVAELGTIAEDLLASGAQVELVPGIERAPARLAEAVWRARTPSLFVHCRRGANANSTPLHGLFEQIAAREHRWLECDLGMGAATLGVRHITAALAELSSSQHGAEPTVPCDTAIDALFDDVAGPAADAGADASAQEVSGVVSLAEPRLLAPPKAPSDRARRTRKASLLVASAGLTAAVVIAGASPREVPADDAAVAVERSPEAAVSAPSLVAPPVLVAQAPKPEPTPTPKPEPARVTIPVPVLVPIVGTQDPPNAGAGDHRTQLDIAIERGHAVVHGGLVVAEAIMGERPWAEAMTSCRARPFWHVRGWRVPTRKELVTLARAQVLPKARIWSSTRGDRRSVTSFVIDGHDAAVSAEPRTEASAVTVCVKRR